MSAFSGIEIEYGEIESISNAGKCGPEKLQIQTFYTQHLFVLGVYLVEETPKYLTLSLSEKLETRFLRSQ